LFAFLDKNNLPVVKISNERYIFKYLAFSFTYKPFAGHTSVFTSMSAYSSHHYQFKFNYSVQAGNPAQGRFTSVEEGPSPSRSITLWEHHPQRASPSDKCMNANVFDCLLTPLVLVSGLLNVRL
jgi:hypothetical protein